MMKKLFLVCGILSLCTSCTEFALLASGSSIALSHSTYAKVSNGVDILSIMSTEKSMKRHVYDNAKKSWTKVKEEMDKVKQESTGIRTSGGVENRASN